MAGRASTVLMMPNMGAYAQSPSYKHISNIYAADAERNVEAVGVATFLTLRRIHRSHAPEYQISLC